MSRVRRGRPELRTSYRQDLALLDTPAKRAWSAGLLLLALVMPFLVTDDWLTLLGTAFVTAIGAIGLNLVTGYAGQVSLGHAFFLGVGAYTGAVVGGEASRRVVGLGFDLPIWLLAAGMVTALAGLAVAPLALRLRGLYLAIVTVGLVFLGGHIFKEATFITGGVGVGRAPALPIVLGYRFDVDSPLLGIPMTREQKLYYLMLVLLVVFGVVARNLARSAVGRAFAAVRDRDIAAAVIGVSVTRTKILAFVISSFYAGVAGALLFAFVGYVEPSAFGLLLSVQYIAMVLIGGAATVSGSILGALFITLLGRTTEELSRIAPAVTDALTLGGLITVFDLQTVLYGLLIVAFLIFEPRGLFGIWVRVRNYWKGWPFSY